MDSAKTRFIHDHVRGCPRLLFSNPRTRTGRRSRRRGRMRKAALASAASELPPSYGGQEPTARDWNLRPREKRGRRCSRVRSYRFVPEKFISSSYRIIASPNPGIEASKFPIRKIALSHL